MADAAILGATGPTGIDLANILHGQRVAVRVVSRSAANLQRAFGEPAFEKVVEDVLDANAAMRAVDGCPWSTTASACQQIRCTCIPPRGAPSLSACPSPRRWRGRMSRCRVLVGAPHLV